MRVETTPTREAKQDTTQDDDSQYERKLRRCMMCGENFESDWAGERICRRCKSTEAYRRG
jgi:hypothetical protein